VRCAQSALKLFKVLNQGKPFDQQVKPFNFMVTAFVPREERPAADQRMVLVAPYERDSAHWLEMPWLNRYSGDEYRLTLEPFRGHVRSGIVRPRTSRNVLRGYLANEESKSTDPDGTPCRPDSTGLLDRRRIRIRTITTIGKESNRLEDAQTGLIEDVDEVVSEYSDYQSRVFCPLIVPILRSVGVRETARRTGYSIGAVSAALAGRSRPRAAHTHGTRPSP
jgi:hypothetical protein